MVHITACPSGALVGMQLDPMGLGVFTCRGSSEAALYHLAPSLQIALQPPSPWKISPHAQLLHPRPWSTAHAPHSAHSGLALPHEASVPDSASPTSSESRWFFLASRTSSSPGETQNVRQCSSSEPPAGLDSVSFSSIAR